MNAVFWLGTVATMLPKQLRLRLQWLHCIALLRSFHHDFSIIPSFCFVFVSWLHLLRQAKWEEGHIALGGKNIVLSSRLLGTFGFSSAVKLRQETLIGVLTSCQNCSTAPKPGNSMKALAPSRKDVNTLKFDTQWKINYWTNRSDSFLFFSGYGLCV